MTEYPIRPDWMYRVRQSCQTFYNRALCADRWEFESVFIALATEVPAAESAQEADALKDRLKICAIEAGVAFHVNFHRRSSRVACPGSAMEASLGEWAQADDPRLALRNWAHAFLAFFDATHHASSAERAAAILRKRIYSPPDLNTLSRTVGTSRAALTRVFREEFGMSVGEYSKRIRLRWFFDLMRASNQSAATLADRAGYKSYHNLTESLRLRTNLSPTDIRHLTDIEVREILDRKLGLSIQCNRAALPNRRRPRRSTKQE